jgi:hypothetical protein
MRRRPAPEEQQVEFDGFEGLDADNRVSGVGCEEQPVVALSP